MTRSRAVQDSITAQLIDLYEQCDVVDLSATLENGIPRWPTHPPLVIHNTVTHEHDGYFTNTIFMPEHIGTHCDAPLHIHPEMREGTIDKMPVDQMIGPACIIDISSRELNEGEIAGEETILEWEQQHGRIGEGEIVLLNFGWLARHWRSDGGWRFYTENSPGLSGEAVRLLYERNIKALGSDLIACDQALINGEGPISYAHKEYMLPNGIPLIEGVPSLDRLPPRCFVVVLPLKIAGGSGSPVRAIALVPKAR